MSGLPLAGRRVLVTRAAHQAGKLSEGLRLLGAEPVEVAVLEMRLPENIAALDAAIASLGSYDWLVLTSANTVRALTDRAKYLNLPLALAAKCQVAAVGSATADAARLADFQITFVPESYVAESLVAGLADRVRGKKILLARAAIARDVVPDTLRSAGATVDVVDAYRNVLPEAAPALLHHAISAGLDAAAFTSSSSVTHLQEAAMAAEIQWPFAGVAALSIGPITSRSLRDSAWEPAIEAERSDIQGLLGAASQLFAKN